MSAIARQLAGITPLEDDEDDDSDNDGSGSSDDGSGNELTPCARDTAEGVAEEGSSAAGSIGIVSREDDDILPSPELKGMMRRKKVAMPWLNQQGLRGLGWYL